METVLWNFAATQKVHRAMQNHVFLPLFKVLITRARWVQFVYQFKETQPGFLCREVGATFKILQKIQF